RDAPAGADALETEVGAAVTGSLLRAGIGVVTDPRLPHDANVRVSVTMRSAGIVVDGTAALTVERAGSLIEQVTVPHDVYRRSRVADEVAGKLVAALTQSPLM